MTFIKAASSSRCQLGPDVLFWTKINGLIWKRRAGCDGHVLKCHRPRLLFVSRSLMSNNALCVQICQTVNTTGRSSEQPVCRAGSAEFTECSEKKTYNRTAETDPKTFQCVCDCHILSQTFERFSERHPAVTPTTHPLSLRSLRELAGVLCAHSQAPKAAVSSSPSSPSSPSSQADKLLFICSPSVVFSFLQNWIWAEAPRDTLPCDITEGRCCRARFLESGANGRSKGWTFL